MTKRKPRGNYTLSNSKAKNQGATDDNHLKRIKRENIAFDSLLLEMQVNYGQ